MLKFVINFEKLIFLLFSYKSLCIYSAYAFCPKCIMNIFSKPILGLFFFSYLWLFESRSFIIFSFIFSLFCILNMFVFLSVVMISFCFPLVLQFGTLFLGILSILYLFLIKCEVKVKVHYFLSIYPYVPGPFTENSIPSPIKLSQHCFFWKSINHIHIDLFLDSIFCSVDLYLNPQTSGTLSVLSQLYNSLNWQ